MNSKYNENIDKTFWRVFAVRGFLVALEFEPLVDTIERVKRMAGLGHWSKFIGRQKNANCISWIVVAIPTLFFKPIVGRRMESVW